MKKFLWSLVALVMFSSLSVAGENTVKDEQLFTKSQMQNELLTIKFWQNATVEEVQQKVKSKTDVNQRDKYGVSVLMYAVSVSAYPDVVDVLLRVGAPLDARDEDGRTPLMYAAAFSSNYQVVQRLLQYGAQINARDKKDWSPLMFAASYNPNSEVVKILIAYGAEVNARVKNPQTQRKKASLANKFVMVVKIGVKAALDFLSSLVHVRSKDDFLAAFNNCIDAMADEILNQEEDMTALLIAARDSSSPDVLQALLDGGADVKLYDVKGKTVLDHAKNNQNISNTPIYWKINDLFYQK